VALNLADDPHDVALPTETGAVVISTHRGRERTPTGNALGLDAWEGVVITSRG
jgi:hypothetical protein